MLVQRPLPTAASSSPMYPPLLRGAMAAVAEPEPPAAVAPDQPAATAEPAAETIALVSLDQLGPHTMTVAANGATDSCPNMHIGALYPPDLERISFRGPIDIDAIGSLDEVPVLAAAAVAPPAEVVQVTERIGQGAIWNAFATTSPGDPLVPSVFKVTCVSAYHSQTDGAAEVAEIRKHIVKEILAHRTLRDVPCVPKLLSVWAGIDDQGREYWATMEEDAGRQLDVEDMSDEQKQAILDAYAAIHERGIMHCDVKNIHWRFAGPPGSTDVRLIDFSHAVDLTELGPEHCRVMCLSEMGDVRDELEAHSKGWSKEPYSLVPSRVPSPGAGAAVTSAPLAPLSSA